MKKRYSFLPETWLRFSLLAAFAVSISLDSSAQNAPTKVWDKTFGANGLEFFSCIKQTSDGGYISGGISDSGVNGDKSQPSRGSNDFWVVKTDFSGNKVWDRTFGGIGRDHINSLQQTSDGGYIIGGSSNSGISTDKSQASKGDADYWIIKLDSNGNKLWDKSIGGTGPDQLTVMQQTADGGYILGGESFSDIGGDKSQASNGLYDFWIIKTDANGNKLWDKTFGGNNFDLLKSLQQTSDGGYILGGYSRSGISGDKSHTNRGLNDYWIVKLDANGTKIWDKTFGGLHEDKLFSLEQTTDGGYLLGGQSYSGASGDKNQPNKGTVGTSCDFWVIKVDINGNKLWEKTWGGNNSETIYSLQQTSDRGFILGGFSNSGIGGDKTQASQGKADFWIVKIDSAGTKTWDLSFGGSSEDVIYSLQETSDGGFILGGNSDSGMSGDKSQASNGDVDFWLVKLSGTTTGIKEPQVNFAVSISPNPNQGKFTLQLSNLSAAKAKVTVSDLLGRVVLQQQLNVSNKQLSEELTLPNAKGMYLLQVKIGEQLITRKVVVE